MFWGIVLKPGASHTLTEGSDLLHVSQACLADSKEGKSQIQVTDNNVTYTIAVLEKDKTEMASLDLFFNTVSPPTFINKGKNDVHLSGYFEMSNDMGSEDESIEEEESEIEEDEDVTDAAAAKAVIAGLTKKNVKPVEDEDEEDDEDDEEEDDEDEDDEMIDDEAEEEDEEDEEDDEDDEDDDDEEDEEEDEDDEEDEDEDDEDEEEEEEEEEEEVAPKANNKRPVAPSNNQPASKVQKTADPADSFAKNVIAYLKSNGNKQSISHIGGKVQKPAGIPKLKQFLASRKEFKVVGDMIELA